MWTIVSMWSMSILAGLLAIQSPPPRPTVSPDLKRAEGHDRRGWTHLEAKDFAAAATAFEAALQIHPEFADALYGLGKARMGLQQYDAAVHALERCRDSYSRAGTQEAEQRLVANTARANQLAALRRRLAELESPVLPAAAGRGAPPAASSEALDLKQQIRTLLADREPGAVTGTPASVPPFVSLALGSAYFRLERLTDAEAQFRHALAMDAKFGEAHNNLALVCLLTGRAAEAQAHVRMAEEARFTVNPELKRQIREALR